MTRHNCFSQPRCIIYWNLRGLRGYCVEFITPVCVNLIGLELYATMGVEKVRGIVLEVLSYLVKYLDLATIMLYYYC